MVRDDIVTQTAVVMVESSEEFPGWLGMARLGEWPLMGDTKIPKTRILMTWCLAKTQHHNLSRKGIYTSEKRTMELENGRPLGTGDIYYIPFGSYDFLVPFVSFRGE